MTVYRTVLPDHCGLVTSDRRELTLSSFVLLHVNVTVHIKQCVLCHPPTPHHTPHPLYSSHCVSLSHKCKCDLQNIFLLPFLPIYPPGHFHIYWSYLFTFHFPFCVMSDLYCIVLYCIGLGRSGRGGGRRGEEDMPLSSQHQGSCLLSLRFSHCFLRNLGHGAESVKHFSELKSRTLSCPSRCFPC